MTSKTLAFAPLFVIALSFGTAHAARTPVEGVAGVVNGTPILFSDVEELRAGLQQQRPAFAALPVADQRHEALERLIDDKIVLEKAKQDTTLRVNDRDVESRAADMYARVAQQQGGERALESALRQATGMSLGQFKARLGDQVRDNMLRQRLQMKYVGDPQPSQYQVKAFFESHRDSLPIQRDVVRLSHLQWRVKASPDIEKESLEKANALVARLAKGESFAELAKLHSDDFSGKEGGDLGYTKRGALDPDYERAAFSLDIGDYTRRPVRTRFGYHLIRVTGKRDNEIRTSHILIRVTPSAADTARARTWLDSLGRTLTTTESFRAATRSFSDDRKTRDLGGDLGWFSRDSLAGAYRAVADSLPEGGVSSPVLVGDSWHLFRVDHKVSERRLSLEEDYSVISQLTRDWMIGDRLEALIKGWREQMHVANKLDAFAGSAAAPASE
ncbi:MAG TPA: peptidylprolyl isomerase [Fibrobacteria bacterium]|nr:peptidylprolyl isomerase [Fibrobacteria bacterium]